MTLFIATGLCFGSLILNVEGWLPQAGMIGQTHSQSSTLNDMTHRRRMGMMSSGLDTEYHVTQLEVKQKLVQYNFNSIEGNSLHSTAERMETQSRSNGEVRTTKKVMNVRTNILSRNLEENYDDEVINEMEHDVELNHERNQQTYFDVDTLGGSSQAGKKYRIGETPVLALEGDSTIERPWQKAVVAAHFAVVLFNVMVASQAILKGMDGMSTFEIITSRVAPILMTIYASILVGDFGTGVFHWSVDNYGNLRTPIVGSICHAFQGHHGTPWTITFRSFANNVFKVAFGCATPLLLLTVAPNVDPYVRLFLGLFINWWLVSQELHKWSHLKKTPPLIKKAMDLGVILSKKEHGKHHTPPFDTNYCILTGQNNKWLDESQFFRRLERLVYDVSGNEPNTWNEEQGGAEVRAKAMDLY